MDKNNVFGDAVLVRKPRYEISFCFGCDLLKAERDSFGVIFSNCFQI
ncbi:hypothetical protein SAMN05216288_3802 [Pseudomonas punonensis]|uniref:Uncharacterized protein n=1 Tax=Phytopseudomonas punonensis TaxID=1220495 RepID=A0A1M7JDA3_9GAMM|nr:hypothetical protein SAMN05216288_3802 [Pseudomonas punonensis]